ncbi:MAG TPA: rod shape-determining protein MreC [Patescibacteria group bacterium]|nr:rod shape-determining protein MreC [Patescibacteria group bacterium]
MQKKYIAIAVVFVLILLIIFANNFLPIKLFGAGIQKIFEAPRIAIYNIKTQVSGNDSKQVEQLKSENAALVKKLVDYEKTKLDNDALRSQFETTQTQNYSLLPAHIMGFAGSFTNPSSIVIDKGVSDGVKKGMAVIFQNNLIGIVDQPSDFYSKVNLSVNQKFSVIAQTSENNSLGITRGQDDFILLDRVPIDNKLSKGEMVLTKGETDSQKLVPSGLVIGKISGISKSENLPFQTAKIESPVNFTKLSTVFVITKL